MAHDNAEGKRKYDRERVGNELVDRPLIADRHELCRRGGNVIAHIGQRHRRSRCGRQHCLRIGMVSLVALLTFGHIDHNGPHVFQVVRVVDLPGSDVDREKANQDAHGQSGRTDTDTSEPSVPR
jgi:hypothetical protein